MLTAVLIVTVGWYFRGSREAVAHQGIAQLHSQWLMGLNMLVADAQNYAKTDPSISPLLASIVTTNSAPTQASGPNK